MPKIHAEAARAAASFSSFVRSPSSPHALAAAGALLVLTGLAGPARASCGSAFCAINTDWGVGITGLSEGSTLDLRHERIRQDRPRTGSRRVGVGEIRHHHDEVSTLNQNLVASFSHMLASGWGVSVVAPLVERDHLHLHNHHGAVLPEEWNFRRLGDVRVAGRYQTFLPGSDAAARIGGGFLGLKLPTGQTDVANAGGSRAERSLQPGSGTTDLIAGGLYHQQFADTGAAWFAQAQVQLPLNRHDGYRPGTQVAVDLGYARPFTQRLSGLIQLNALVRQRDRGENAEPADSGGRFLFLSPGLSYRFGESWNVYGYYQHPLHQHVNGVQLTAQKAVVIGVTMRF